jgi:hypothetical protein
MVFPSCDWRFMEIWGNKPCYAPAGLWCRYDLLTADAGDRIPDSKPQLWRYVLSYASLGVGVSNISALVLSRNSWPNNRMDRDGEG